MKLLDKIAILHKIAFGEFTDSYIDYAIWSSDLGKADIQNLSPECKAQMHQDCQAFQRQNANLLHKAYEAGSSESRMGQDFWAARNYGGTGFKDGHIPDDIGNALTLAAHKFGGMDLYVGDDGMIYCSPIKLLN